jgi:hypothetical protein
LRQVNAVLASRIGELRDGWGGWVVSKRELVGSKLLEELSRHSELERIKQLFSEWQQAQHAPYRRLSFVAATNEVMLRTFGSYSTAWQFLLAISEKYPTVLDVVTAPRKASKSEKAAAAKGDKRDENRNFINWISRQSDSSTFSVWEAAILVHACRARNKDRTDQVIDTLSPYQQYLLEWSALALEGKVVTGPRESNDSGTSHAEWRRTGQIDQAQHRWYDLHQAMTDHHRNTNYWDGVFRDQERAGFVVFRPGLRRNEKLVQTYLSLVDGRKGQGNQGIFSYAHIYRPPAAPAGQVRYVRGLMIPSASVLYLLGVRDATSKVAGSDKIVDFRNPVEVLAIPVTPLVQAPVHVQGLTLTSNQEGRPLLSRVLLRRTFLQNHLDANIGTHDLDELKESLRAIHNAERGEAPSASDDEKKLAEEFKEILECTNNQGELSLCDFRDPDDPAKLISAEDLIARVEEKMKDVFRPDGRTLIDALGSRFDRGRHWRFGSIGTAQ